jgi:alpha-L-fucosidase 2
MSNLKGKFIWPGIVLQFLVIHIGAQTQPLKLWYEQPAVKWTEALPIGNGRIGAMIFGGLGQDRIQFNEETLWTGEPRDYNRAGAGKYLDTIRQLLFQGRQKEAEQLAGEQFMGMRSNEGRYQADYQPFGDLWLDFENAGTATNYKRELDITNAIANTSYTLNGVDYKREYFISQPAQLVIIRVSADKADAVSFVARLNSPHEYCSVKKINNNTIALSLKVKNGALRGESFLQVNAIHGKVEVQGDKIIIKQADEVVLYLSAGTNYKNYKNVTGDPVAVCKKSLQNTTGKTWQQLRDAHVKEYQSYFNTLSFNLGKSENEKLPTDARLKQFATSNDPAFVALYLQYGRYLLISASRPGTRPANLQGIWNDLLAPPWGSKYTTNINLEMNYWPAELLNLSPMAEPLFTMIGELAQSGKETAHSYYNAPGWVLHHNTDLWRGTAPINASNHGIWVSGGAWLCHHLWEHYLFTQDKTFLRDRAYPLMKEAALFFNSFLVRDPQTGWLISTPSNSPEQGGLVAGPTMDHQIIRDLFKNVMEASEILGIDKSFAETLKAKYGRIAPNQIGKYGQLQEWMQDKDDTSSRHRHVSHLWGLFPGSEINYEETPKLVEAARQSLIYRGDAATGWSLGWKINFWARLKDADHAYKLIQMLLSPAGNAAGSYPNLFDAHPPFQIDGNFGGSAGIGELLLQSHTRYIDLLPALPSAWPDGEIKGIKARGGFELTIKWKNGKLEEVGVLSTAGTKCLLKYGSIVKEFSTEKGKRYLFNGKLEITR